MDADWHVDGLTVGQVAARMRIAESAVRWYADQGLLPCERVAGKRRFFADVLCRVAMIRASQEAGLSLAEIGAALEELPPKQAPSRQDWERLAARLRREVNRRIDELVGVLEGLATSAPPLPAPVGSTAASAGGSAPGSRPAAGPGRPAEG
ncbi:MerR family DNA-binding protein [Blastococcus sp. SYSU DS0552]